MEATQYSGAVGAEVDDVVVGEVLQGRRAALGERVVCRHGQHTASGEHGGADGEVGLGNGQPQHVHVAVSGAQSGERVAAVDFVELDVDAGVAGSERVDEGA
jgi:hypothetical protein